MTDKNKNKIQTAALITLLIIALVPKLSLAQADNPIIANFDGGKISLKVNSTPVVKTVRPYKRVSVGQPDVADFNAIAPTSILLTAKKPGTTQLIIWDDQERSQIMDVNVAMDLDALKDQYKLAFPNSKIDVGFSNNTIILRGQIGRAHVCTPVTL